MPHWPASWIYWKAVNSALRRGHPKLDRYLKEEAEIEEASLDDLKDREISTLRDVEAAIRNMSREQAVAELIKARKLRERTQQIEKVTSNELLGH